MSTCTVCGVVNAESARFCGNCGSAMSPRCGRCGADLPGPVRFCPTCGAPVVDAASLQQERKLVAVLFADVFGSTGLAERLDPEGLKEVMDAFFEAMRRAIEAQGGTVEKFIGDAVMAVFGVPVAHEDDATRALRAALGMRRALEELNRWLLEAHGLTLAMRIGISLGDVVAVTSPRPGEGMVTGDAVNVAARLEQSAPPGHIRVAERAARAARGFRLVETGPLRLKGKDQPVHAYELLGEAAGEHPPLQFTAPMIGRDREMALLQSVYERVASEEHPYLVTIYGEAGVGKSRLVTEFGAWTERQEAPPRVVRGRCLPYGEGVTYWPMAEILKQQAGVLDSDPPRLALRKIELLGKEFLSPDLSADPARATAALCFTMGLHHPGIDLAGTEPRQAGVEISSAWRSYFSALAADRPTVVVIEDLHWADVALLDLLEELAERVEGPILFVCPARPELTGRRPEWGGGRWNFSGILLEPLTIQDAERLVGFLLEEQEPLPQRIQTRMLERSGGNPFFLEEITRHLLDELPSGVKAPTSEQPMDVEDVEIPDTVQGVLAARMDLLGQLEKRTLQSASVVGRVFWTGPLVRLLGSEPGQLEEALGRLEDRGLVVTRLSSSLAGQREFIFKHILTRDVAYESLPRRERAAAHAEVAGWMEETAGERRDEFIELLTHHYAEAFRFSREQTRPDAGQSESLRLKALGYALEASRLARGRLVLDAAQRMAEIALSLAVQPLERSEALEALGETYFLSSQGDLAWACFREAVDVRLAGQEEHEDLAVARLCARALEVVTRGRGAMRSRLTRGEASPYLEIGLRHVTEGDSEELVRLLTVQAFWPYSFREMESTPEERDRAREAGERGADMAGRLGRADLASAALDGVASYYQSNGLYGRMAEVVDRRLQLVDALGDPLEVGDVFAVAAWSAFHVGRYREAVGFADEGVRRTIPGAQLMGLYCLDFRAVARCRLGEWDAFLEDVAFIAELLGDRSDHPPGFASDHVAAAAFVYEARGDQPAAEHMLRVLSWLEGAEVRPSPGWSVWKSLLLSRRGEFEAARELLARPEEGLPWGRGYRLEALCDVLAEQGAWDEAAGTVEEARRHSEEAALLALPRYADRLEGLMQLAHGHLDVAATLLERARKGFTDLEAGWESARTALKLAAVLLLAGRADEARGHLERSLPDLERLQSVREVAAAKELLVE